MREFSRRGGSRVRNKDSSMGTKKDSQWKFHMSRTSKDQQGLPEHKSKEGH